MVEQAVKEIKNAVMNEVVGKKKRDDTNKNINGWPREISETVFKEGFEFIKKFTAEMVID